MDDNGDEENEEDLNELEALLYAQIHHRMDERSDSEEGVGNERQVIESNTRSTSSRVPTTRYWVCGKDANNTAIRSPIARKTQFSIINKNNAADITKLSNDKDPVPHTVARHEATKRTVTLKRSLEELPKSLPAGKQNQQPTHQFSVEYTWPSQSRQLASNKQQKPERQQQKIQQFTIPKAKNKKNLSASHSAKAGTTNKQIPANKSQPQEQNFVKELTVTSKNIDGGETEARRQKKRLKVDQLHSRRTRARKSRAMGKRLAIVPKLEGKPSAPIACFNLISSDEDEECNGNNNQSTIQKKIDLPKSNNTVDNDGDDEDVILVPATPPPCITIVETDSNDEEEDPNATNEKNKDNFGQEQLHDENAMDCTSTINSNIISTSQTEFVRPFQYTSQQRQLPIETPPRCLSPSSVQSSDDFIGQADRTRLLQRDNGANDEELFGLTNDTVDNSVDNTNHPSVAKEIEEERDNEKGTDSKQSHIMPAPSSDTSTKHQYVVDGPQYRATDVYESESDVGVGESVYSKGTSFNTVANNMPTIIRAISTSGDEDTNNEDDDVVEIPAALDASASSSSKIKRKRKRHFSELGKNNNMSSDDDDDDNDDGISGGDNITNIPFISRGIALERCRKSSISLPLSVKQRKNRSGPNQMSDSDFISTLNDLAQGGDGVPASDGYDSDNDDDEAAIRTAPSARDIAERVLSSKSISTGATVTTSPSTLVKNPAAKRFKKIKTKNKPPNDDIPVIIGNAQPQNKALPYFESENLERDLASIDLLQQSKEQARRMGNISPELLPIDIEERDISATNSTILINTDSVDSISDDEIDNDENDENENDAIATTQYILDADKRSDPLYNTIFSYSDDHLRGIGWNDEMQRFYNYSWNGENFQLKEIWKRMNPKKQLWRIQPEDRFPRERNRLNQMCHNCKEIGHVRVNCPQPKKVPICYMCGEQGHYEPRCPNTLCLRCGNKTSVFTKSCNACVFQNRLNCPLCKVHGHVLNNCPDKWRRYHSTTVVNEYPNSDVEYKRRKFCSICSRRGHLSDMCKSAVRFLDYPKIVCHVKSHQKSYDDVSPMASEQNIGIAYNLLYKPSDNYSFEFAATATKDNYYGRFLNAVGMSYLFRRKRTVSIPTTIQNTSVSDVICREEPSAKRRSFEPYKSNPQVSTMAPEQVPEVSKSGIQDDEDDDDDRPTTSKAAAARRQTRTKIVQTMIEIDGSSNDNISSSQQEIRQDEGQEEVVCISDDHNDETPNEINEMNNQDRRNNSSSSSIDNQQKSSMDKNQLADSFKAPCLALTASVNVVSPQTIGGAISPTAASMLPVSPHHLDSDSNYSFSEHFGGENTTQITTASNNATLNTSTIESTKQSTALTSVTLTMTTPIMTIAQQRPPPRPMSTQPDFIPLNAGPSGKPNSDVVDKFSDGDAQQPKGISRCFVAAESDEDQNHEARRPNPFTEVPCNAKIFLTNFHSKYLLSPIGNAFLEDASKRTGVRARLDFTSVGHVLILFGTPSQQDTFHIELSSKYRELTNEMTQNRSSNYQKVPKRADALIRCLRENILQLMSPNSLGNVNELWRRLQNSMQSGRLSKTAIKLEDKARRTLNMILIGQAGLLNGAIHLDNLIICLKEVITKYRPDAVVAEQLRHNIDSHWKVIFTPYRHNNYGELVNTYNRMSPKNRIQELNIDPVLLGMKTIDTSFSAEQRDRLRQGPQQQSHNQWVKNPMNSAKASSPSIPPPPPSMLLPSPPQAPPPPSMRLSSPSKAPPAPSMKLFDQEDEANEAENFDLKSMMREIDDKANDESRELCEQEQMNVVEGPSKFWSVQAITFLDDCIAMAESNRQLLDKLQRIHAKARSGMLTYKDYRAVMRLHKVMLGGG